MQNKTDPVITTLTLGGTSIQKSIEFPARTKAFSISNRSSNAYKYAWVDADIAAGNYFTVPMNTIFTEEHLFFSSGFTLYLMANNADDVLEIAYWQ